MLRSIVAMTVCLGLLVPIVLADDAPYGDVRLLNGYKYSRGKTVDTINGVIYKEGGLTIEFESGISEGYAVKPDDQNKYLWYREQIVNGHKVLVALTKPGVATKWAPDKPRDSKPMKILMVTFPGKFSRLDAANFHAEVLNEAEIADMLLMVLTFNPDR